MIDERFRLHHVGILVDDVANASALFASRFGYEADTPIIEDQRQTAFAQFLRLPGSGHWTELISPNGPASVLAGALKQRRGGVHHVCYQVSDIEHACSSLRGQAMTIIAPPVPGVAFGGRRIAWLIDRNYFLVELVEAGPGPLCLPPDEITTPPNT